MEGCDPRPQTIYRIRPPGSIHRPPSSTLPPLFPPLFPLFPPSTSSTLFPSNPTTPKLSPPTREKGRKLDFLLLMVFSLFIDRSCRVGQKSCERCQMHLSVICFHFVEFLSVWKSVQMLINPPQTDKISTHIFYIFN